MKISDLILNERYILKNGAIFIYDGAIGKGTRRIFGRYKSNSTSPSYHYECHVNQILYAELPPFKVIYPTSEDYCEHCHDGFDNPDQEAIESLEMIFCSKNCFKKELAKREFEHKHNL